ncbi:MAG: tripartite tricarboxylate transporter substrate binding protein [Alphaproteobacteria bacterium]|nr:tripartite tricarboxylate transporter substrate binding protein [Alphaproteobacteria bacterium]
MRISRLLSGLAAAALTAAVFSAPAAAQSYPTRNVRIIVPFGAGGPADVYARVLAELLGKAMGQSFTVENRPGAGAVIGTNDVAKSKPDGYTLLMMSNTHATNETLIPNKPYDLMRDFAPVAGVNYSDLVMVAHPSLKVKDLKEFIALAQSKPNGLNYASSGPGTPYHMAGELFKAMSKTQIVHVPYKSSGGARNDILAGHVHMMFDAVTVMTQNIQAGKVIALATSGSSRTNVLPNVPTLAESGVPGYSAAIWLGIMAPKGTPADIINRLNAEIKKAQNSAAIKAAWEKQGAEPYSMTPAQFEEFLKVEIKKWGEVVKVSGLLKQ